MSLLERLGDENEWQEFLQYKTDKGHLTKSEEKDLRNFIESKAYLPVIESINAGWGLSIPQKKMIRKTGTDKKRVVYLYPRDENHVLKMLTFLLLREYDNIFSDNLYSFRVSCGVNKVIQKVLKTPNINDKYTYKVDISNYFNSIDIEKMLEILKDVLKDDKLFDFFSKVLRDKRVDDGGTVLTEEKGVMAGTPFAVFLANVYLMPMDKEAQQRGINYARYSDDIIIFSDSEKSRDEEADFIRKSVLEAGLEINEKKEIFTFPGEVWSFLGIKYDNGMIDISDVSREKIKAKIRRRARSIKRWQVRKNATNEQAVKAFIKAMNRKFFSADASSELTWSRWYFPVITTDSTLHELDLYIQQWIRYLATGNHSKSNYSFRYEDMKRLGYVSLVHEWYNYRA